MLARPVKFGWGTRHYVLFYGSGLLAAFVGQSLMHNFLQPDMRLPPVPKAATPADEARPPAAPERDQR